MRRFVGALPFSLIVIAALSRLIPHPPNMTPIGAMALFAGATLSSGKSRWTPYAAAFLALLLSDLIIGFYSGMLYVYAGFALTVWIGSRFASQMTALRIGASATASSVAFFVLSNFGVWMAGGLYPRTLEGLGQCYLAAIPFYHQSLAGDLLCSAALFAVYRSVKARSLSLA